MAGAKAKKCKEVEGHFILMHRGPDFQAQGVGHVTVNSETGLGADALQMLLRRFKGRISVKNWSEFRQNPICMLAEGEKAAEQDNGLANGKPLSASP